MIALRWTRRLLDGLLLLAIAAVVAIAGITVLAQVMGGRSLILAGGSMEPTLPRGAYVLTLPIGAEGYGVGDIVTVATPGTTPYTHRVVRLVDLPSGLHVETKGDANPQPEPVVIPVANLAGRVAFSLPLVGYLAMVLASPVGLLGFLLVCGTMLLLVWLIEELEIQECPACAAQRRHAMGLLPGQAAAVGAGALAAAAAVGAGAPAVAPAPLSRASARHDHSGSHLRGRAARVVPRGDGPVTAMTTSDGSPEAAAAGAGPSEPGAATSGMPAEDAA